MLELIERNKTHLAYHIRMDSHMPKPCPCSLMENVVTNALSLTEASLAFPGYYHTHN